MSTTLKMATKTRAPRAFDWLQHITTSVVLPCLLYVLSLGKTLHEAFYLLADDIPLLGQAHGLYVWVRAAFWFCRWNPGPFLRPTADSAIETLTAAAVDLATKWNNTVNIWTTEFESLTSQIMSFTSQINEAHEAIFADAISRQYLAGAVSIMLLASIFVMRRAGRRTIYRAVRNSVIAFLISALTRQYLGDGVGFLSGTLVLVLLHGLKPSQKVQESLTPHRTVRFSPTQELISNDAPADNDGSRYVDLVETRPGVFSPVKRCSRLRGSSI